MMWDFTTGHVPFLSPNHTRALQESNKTKYKQKTNNQLHDNYIFVNS